MKKKRINWTKESAFTEARKYSSRGVFNRERMGCVKYLKRHSWYEEACEHMEPLFTNWTPELAIQTARQFDTIVELIKNRNDCYQYLLKNKDTHKLATAHMNDNRKWTPELAIKTARQFNTISELQRNRNDCYQYLIKIKDTHKIATAHMKVLRTDWTPELAIKTARQFDTISELVRNRNDCYIFLQRNKKLHKLATAHMTKAEYMTEDVNGVYIIRIQTKNTNKFVYYVGQTYTFRNRFYSHLHGNSPIFTYLSTHNCHKPEFYILAENLPLEEALELERNTIENLYLRGLNLLNVSILDTIKSKHPELPTVQKNIGLRGLKLKKFKYGVD